jgi:hypothetical protein
MLSLILLFLPQIMILSGEILYKFVAFAHIKGYNNLADI